MCRLFGQPDENNTYLLDINGRKAKVYSKYGNTWTVEAENYQVYSKLITKIQIEA
jgi:outer membrane biogenesis lipoprotein LolB